MEARLQTMHFASFYRLIYLNFIAHHTQRIYLF